MKEVTFSAFDASKYLDSQEAMNDYRLATRAPIYLRISRDADVDGLTIDRQRQDCEAIAKQRGLDVGHRT